MHFRPNIPMGRTMACDLGSERIGVALSDLSNTLASPHGTVRRSGAEREDHEALATIAREYEVDHVIIGLPKPLRGHQSPAVIGYAAEAERIGQHLGVRVTCLDERFTTVIAQRQRAARAKKGRTDIDAEAAAVLLQDFLDRNKAG